jgi:integrase
MPDASTQTGPETTRRPLKETTTKKYDQAIARLKDLDLSKPQEFFDYVKEKGLGESAEKQHLSAIKYYLNKENIAFPNAYQKRIDELYGKQNEQDVKQELKPKLLEKFVPYDKLMEAQKKLADNTDKTEKQWVDYVVASLYTLNPPLRNEFGDMKVFKRRDTRRKGNEMIWSKKPVIIMREYKTNGTTGEVEIPISKELREVIASWFSHLGGIPPYVLGTKYSDTASLKLIASAFGTTGKFVGIDNLRHSYIQHHLPAIATNLEKRRILADRMLHSVETQLKYFSQNITEQDD